jgi:guanylate kinase
MNEQKGTLFVLTGPSGAGKGTLLSRVLPQLKSLFLSVSATTRAPRPGEEDGIHYYFLSREQFEEKVHSDEFLEHAQFSGNYYGTPSEPIDNHLCRGEDVVLEIEVQGAMQIREKRPDAVMIFVAPPDFETLEARLRGRQTEAEDAIALRLQTAKNELRQINRFDYLVINDDLNRAEEELKAVFLAERARTSRRVFSI